MRRTLRDGMILTAFGVVLGGVIERLLRPAVAVAAPPAAAPVNLNDAGGGAHEWSGVDLSRAPQRY